MACRPDCENPDEEKYQSLRLNKLLKEAEEVKMKCGTLTPDQEEILNKYYRGRKMYDPQYVSPLTCDEKKKRQDEEILIEEQRRIEERKTLEIRESINSLVSIFNITPEFAEDLLRRNDNDFDKAFKYWLNQ
jgi:hypothetical protein